MMKRIEAIALLARCGPLAAKLAAQGVNIELTEQDRAALVGFNQLVLDDWLADPDIHQEAGLGRADINAVGFVAARAFAEEMRRQHESGEQVD